MEERKCELRLPNGKTVSFSYAKLKAGIAVTALLIVGAVGGAGYLYHQLADYRSEAADYATKLQGQYFFKIILFFHILKYLFIIL